MLFRSKDSWALIQILDVLRQRAPIDFSIVAVNVDSGYEGYQHTQVAAACQARGWEFHSEHTSIGAVIDDKLDGDQTPCSLCARLRRGVLYRVATELGATKIALGHHRDDILETFLLNMFYGGKLKTMPPKLMSDDGKHIVIRPLAYCEEKDLAEWAEVKQFPIIPCTLCGSQENLKRKEAKALLREWEKKFPGRVETILTALQNITPSHMLDRQLFDFKAVFATGIADPEGDKAFDAG